jgi:ribonuclease HIII
MTTTLELSPAEIDALRADLEARGFEFRRLDHAHWQARGEGVVVNAYRSGKVVVQGAGAEAFLASRGLAARPALLPLDEPVAGSDESGKGDYFGPMVVAATVAGPADVAALERLAVRDSKRLSDGAALRAAVAIRQTLPHALRVLDPADYNARHERDGNVALFLSAMHADALAEALRGAGPCRRIVIDQFTATARLEGALRRKGIDLPVEIRPRAEDNPAVAAASILARAEFLVRLKELGGEIGWELPKGAGPPVEAVAREIYRAGGEALLARVAKLHFKTTGRVTRP